MDHVSAGEATRDGARTRRRRMRDQARSHHAAPSPVSVRYQTPEWLGRSFVLPLTQPEASDVPQDVPQDVPGELPSQPVPHHDDDPRTEQVARVEPPDVSAVAAPSPRPAQFVRPPSDQIDFGRMIRRSDLCRRAGRLSWATAGVAGLALIAYLLMTSLVVLGAAIVFALASVAALAFRIKLSRSPIPRLQR